MSSQRSVHIFHLVTALTKKHKAQSTCGTFGPLSLQRIGLQSHPLMFGVSCPILGVISDNLLPTFHSHFWEKSYLDSITRLLPTVKVSVHQNVHPNSSSHDSAKRESNSSSYSAPHSLYWSSIRGPSPSFQDKFTSIQPRPFPHPIFPKCCFCAKYSCSTVGHCGAARGGASSEPYNTHSCFPSNSC